MAFDLKITFTGMMLYVPSGSKLDVLIPKTAETIPAPVLTPEGGCSGGNDDCVEPHAARITFDTAYTRPGATGLDDVLAHASLRQKRLTVPAVGSAYVKGIPSEVALASSPVRQDVLDGQADGELAARVELSSGRATWADPGECWELQGTIRRMSHQVEWVISGVPGDYIDLPLTDLSGMAYQGTLPRLYPVAGVVDLWVWHAPAYEIPPDAILPAVPANGAMGHHFAHLGRLLDARSLEMPLFRPNVCPPLSPEERTRHKDKGGAALNCTGAQFPVTP